jgi:carbon storage regulator CsrA
MKRGSGVSGGCLALGLTIRGTSSSSPRTYLPDMLVLKRKLGEGFVIGDDIEVVVLHLERGTVSIGIKAPDEVTIRRSELGRIPRGRRRFRPDQTASEVAGGSE